MNNWPFGLSITYHLTYFDSKTTFSLERREWSFYFTYYCQSKRPTSMQLRIGNGIDFHVLSEGAPFWLGGIRLEHHKGTIGYSDADVLLHAICDALLGALALGDIGKHFPDNDPAYKGIDSKILLKRCCDLIEDKGYKVGNLDATVCLQKPKILPYISSMRACIATVMDLEVDAVSVKATTTEQMGFVGREEGVMAYATVLLVKE